MPAKSSGSTDQLFDAIRKHSIAGVRAAIAAGARINTVRRGWSALANAARIGGNKNDLAIARFLLEHGADPNGPSVMAYCRVDLLPDLVARGGRVDGNPKEVNPLMAAIAARRKEDRAQALLDAGANPNVRDSHGSTPLIEAAKHGRGKVFDALLKRGADTTAVDQTGRSALRYAAESLAYAGHATESATPALRRIVRILRDRLPAQPEDAILASLAAADVDDVRRRLDAGLDPNTRIAGLIGLLGIRGETLLESIGGFFGFFGDPIDQPKLDQRGSACTLLMWAVAFENIELIRLLLERGADPSLKTTDGVSATDISLRTRSPRIREMLGTVGVEVKGLKSPKLGDRKPSLQNERRIETGQTLADRLAVDMKRTQSELEDVGQHRLRLPTRDEIARQYGFGSRVFDAWKVVSTYHVVDQPAEMRKAAEITLQLAEIFFLSPQEIPDRKETHWMEAFRAAMGAASVLNRHDRLRPIARWVSPQVVRGARSPMYNEDYFLWPLVQIWSREIRGEAPDPKFRKLIDGETARWPKLLLAAWDQMLASSPGEFVKAIGRCVEQHRKKAIWKGSGVADRIAAPELCFLVWQARARELSFALPDAISDWVIDASV